MKNHNNIKILDCTLRDGGRIINCDFGEQCIINLSNDLQASKIDYIEMGFIRNRITYRNGSTFFTRIEQIKPYIHNSNVSKFVLFVDHGMFDVEQLENREEDNPVFGIRVGFKKGQFKDCLAEIRRIQEKGYQVFLQDVNTLGYSDDEILQMIDIVNSIKPYAFAVVDTYGAMYKGDLIHYIELLHKNLNMEIAIDFHSHNNYQLSYSLAQEVAGMSDKYPERNFIIDSTLYGMGKVAGNLNTELIANYLVEKYGKNYDTSIIFDTIDENIMPYYKRNFWGYSNNALLSGKYMSHPNNVIYLTEKFKLDTNDIGNILAMIGKDKLQTYDYDNIENCYITYNAKKESKKIVTESLKQKISGRKILVVAPGNSLRQCQKTITQLVAKDDVLLISVNFIYYVKTLSMAFFANQKRYKMLDMIPQNVDIILSSNVREKTGKEYIIDYKTVIRRGWKNFDNATIMLLRFLVDEDIRKIYIAGFDGMVKGEDNFYSADYEKNLDADDYEIVNHEITEMYTDVKNRMVKKGIEIEFLTPSIYNMEGR